MDDAKQPGLLELDDFCGPEDESTTCSKVVKITSQLCEIGEEVAQESGQLNTLFVNLTWQAVGLGQPINKEACEVNEVHKYVKAIQEKYKEKLLVVARDKLDNVHSVRQNLLAYELFLNKYPERLDPPSFLTQSDGSKAATRGDHSVGEERSLRDNETTCLVVETNTYTTTEVLDCCSVVRAQESLGEVD